jgi:hypothetical protein
MHADDEELALVLEHALDTAADRLRHLQLMTDGLGRRCDDHHDVAAVQVTQDLSRRLGLLAATVRQYRETVAMLRWRDDADEDARPTTRLQDTAGPFTRPETTAMPVQPDLRPLGLPVGVPWKAAQ